MSKTKIEWVKNDDGSQGMSANPIRGRCLHACPYCYAERIRQRYEQPEEISWYPEVLEKIRDRKKPTTYFMGSMHDLCGEWVSNERFSDIVSTTIDCPHHRFIFLTKNAKRMWAYPLNAANIWFGGTVTSTADRINGYFAGGCYPRWAFVSFEPVLGEIRDFEIPRNIKWFIIGALTRSGVPVPASLGGTRLEWVLPLIDLADRHGIPVFLKDNLLELYPELPNRQEVPWVKG